MDTKTLLQQALDVLSLTPSERQFYLTLIKTKNPRVVDVVKLSSLRRPTAYQALKKLKALGLVVGNEKKYGQHISAMPPHKLLQLVAAKQREVRKLELKLRDNLDLLKASFRSAVSVPRVEQFEGKLGFDELHTRSLATRSRLIRYMGNVEDYLDVFDEDTRQEYTAERVRLGITLRVICNENEATNSNVSRDTQELRERKVIPQEALDITSSLVIFDETVIYFSLSHEQLAVAVTSSAISSLMDNIFDDVWKRY